MHRMRGFTLLELLVVLGVIGALASVVLPNLALTGQSQMRQGINEFAITARATFDAAVLTSRTHRLVVNVNTGEYWAEMMPDSLRGRPASASIVDARELSAKEDARAKTLEDLDKLASEKRPSKEDEKRMYSFRSILVVQRDVLRSKPWKEVDDPTLYRRRLPGSVVFASIVTEQMEEPLEFRDAPENATVSIYFFSTGEAMLSSVQLAMKGEGKTINEQEPKFTLNLDALTGQSEILEGQVEADFLKKRR